jgi:hypothetical protein
LLLFFDGQRKVKNPEMKLDTSTWKSKAHGVLKIHLTPPLQKSPQMGFAL